jgi:hypothetical protein
MLTIDYHTTTEIWLHLEDYYNAGVTPQQAKEVIESIADGAGRLTCRPSHCNGNWIVQTLYTSSNCIEAIVADIQNKLDALVQETKPQPEMA